VRFCFDGDFAGIGELDGIADEIDQDSLSGGRPRGQNAVGSGELEPVLLTMLQNALRICEAQSGNFNVLLRRWLGGPQWC
jgi:hypothetical protein